MPALLHSIRHGCSNVLLSSDCRAFVADLGAARVLSTSLHGLTGFSVVYAGAPGVAAATAPAAAAVPAAASTAAAGAAPVDCCCCCCAVVLLRATHPSLDALTGGALMPPAVRLLKIHSVHFISLPLSFLAAPEQLMGQRCSLAADLYSFGIQLIELITQEQSGGRGEWRLPRAPEECPQVRKRVGEWVGGVAVWRCGLHKRERHAWAPG